MVGKQEPRRLEVLVLAARGLPASQGGGGGISFGEGRRKVQMTLVSPKDPEGEAFGAKVSPWTEPATDARSLRFGCAGLRCSFPLEVAQGAPAVVADPRFTDTTRLRIRLLSSMVPSHDSALKKVAGLLPSALFGLADGVSRELDEATATLEAEAQIPLANILSGRVGFAADRALGGWVPLQMLDAKPSVGFEEAPPLSLWMQMYALPDHEGWLPQLQKQLQDEIRKQPAAGGKAAPVPKAASGGLVPNTGYANATGQAAGTRRLSDLASANGAPRWGPAAQGSQRGAPSAAAMQDLMDVPVPDLIDISLDDDTPAPSPPSALAAPASGFDFVGASSAADDLLSLDGAAEVGGTLPRLGEIMAPEPLPLASLEQAPSKFSFMAASSATLNSSAAFVAPAASGFALPPGPSAAAASAAPAEGSSAFGFIAAAKPGAMLDLASLYSNPGEVPRPSSLNPATSARYDYLMDLGRTDVPSLDSCGPNFQMPASGSSSASSSLPPSGGASSGKNDGGKTLASWEQNIMAGLTDSMRT